MKSKSEVLRMLKRNTVSFATVSGIVTTKPGVIERIDNEIPEFAVITTKSYQVNPNHGNREPVIVEPEEGKFGNAVGLRNPGMIRGYEDLLYLRSRHSLTAVLNVSVSGNSVEEFITLVKKFEDIADIIELNLSCPHASGGYGMAIGTDPEIVYTYIKRIREITDALIFPKLTPNVQKISEIALSALEGGADGITAINTVGPELYIEPFSGKPILKNKSGHKGGMSGRWIKETALQKISEIRTAVGTDLPIIGMGGIETGEDVRNIKDAGADVVGIGSLFASVHPDNWKGFFSVLKADTENKVDNASIFRNRKRKMEYVPHKILKITDLQGDVRVLELDGKINFDSSEFAFLWLPDIGEKPFSIFKGDPLTFIIRKKGVFTSAVMSLKESETIFVRGIYGKDSPETKREAVYIAAGGTGLAVALGLAEKLFHQGKKVHTFFGMSSPGQIVLEGDFLQWGSFTAAADKGVPGRVIDIIKERLSSGNEKAALYTIGPLPFMEKASEAFISSSQRWGGTEEDVFLSIETPTRCGVGLCGECECGGHLTCREGTFFSLEYLNSRNINLEELLHED
jgi:dihydroorotate dehydrogenase electron transfer subunit